MNLLLLHGVLGTRHQMGMLREVLPGVSTLAVEFRGHGERAIPDEGLSMEVFLRDMEDALDDAGWSEAHRTSTVSSVSGSAKRSPAL